MEEEGQFVQGICHIKMKMIKVFFTLMIFNSCISTSRENSMELDRYINMNIGQVIDELGPPDFRAEQIIDDKYFPTPIEPIYAAYFTKEELEKTVTINVAKWVNGKTNIITWLKKVENDWIVFSSLKYNKSSNMQI